MRWGKIAIDFSTVFVYQRKSQRFTDIQSNKGSKKTIKFNWCLSRKCFITWLNLPSDCFYFLPEMFSEGRAWKWQFIISSCCGKNKNEKDFNDILLSLLIVPQIWSSFFLCASISVFVARVFLLFPFSFFLSSSETRKKIYNFYT